MRGAATNVWGLRAGPLLLLLVLMRSGWVHGQEPGEISDSSTTDTQAPVRQSDDSAAKRFFRTLWSDQKAFITAPMQMNRGHGATIAALPLLVGTGALIPVDKDAAQWLPNTPDQVKWSKRVSHIGAVYTLGGIVGGAFLLGSAKDDSEISRIGRSSARALISSVILNYGMKFAAGRERPPENDGQGRFWKGSNSFPSQHSMNSWAVALVVGRSRKSPKWLKITSYSVAVAVSLSRWGARKHFPSDILAGSLMGGLIGNYVVTR